MDPSERAGSTRAPTAGSDQAYLRDVEYRDGTTLDVRARLHRELASSPITFTSFEARLADWPAGREVLDAGCGTGGRWSTPEPPAHSDRR